MIDSEHNVFTRYSVDDNPFGELPEEEDVEDVVMEMRGVSPLDCLYVIKLISLKRQQVMMKEEKTMMYQVY